MGGNALKEYGTRRYKVEEFQRVWGEVYFKIIEKEATTILSVIPFYHEKQEFGDMDIIIQSFPNVDMHKYLLDIFKPEAYYSNGNVLSIKYEELQIDFIITPKEYYHVALNYFSWNDLGNLIGRIYHKLGFKYGHDGLWYILRDPDNSDHMIKAIPVSLDIDDMLNFIGLERPSLFGGFDSPVEIWDYVISSPFFDEKIYAYENLNAENRVRNRKRTMYQGFLDYVNNHEIKGNFSFEGIDKKTFLPFAFSYFPGFRNEYEKAMYEFYARKQIMAEKFNGARISEITELTGKELGKLMCSLRAEIMYGYTGENTGIEFLKRLTILTKEEVEGMAMKLKEALV